MLCCVVLCCAVLYCIVLNYIIILYLAKLALSTPSFTRLGDHQATGQLLDNRLSVKLGVAIVNFAKYNIIPLYL